MHIAPVLLTIQPTIAFAPRGASETGSMKIPEPIIVPTTMALVSQIPMEFCWSGASSGCLCKVRPFAFRGTHAGRASEHATPDKSVSLTCQVKFPLRSVFEPQADVRPRDAEAIHR